MLKSFDVQLTAFISIGFFLLFLVKNGFMTGKELWNAVSSSVSFAIIGRLIFLKYVWKYIPLLEKIHKVPILEGSWEGVFESTWRATPESPPATGAIQVEIVQPDLYTIKITQRSGESVSTSYGETIEVQEGGAIFLNFSYRNDPNAQVRDRSHMSYGTARYEVIRDGRSHRLVGNYFTDRKSTGHIKLTRKES